MEDLSSILLRDYGIKPHGKSSPMSASPPVPFTRTSSSPGKLENGSNLSNRSSARVLGERLHLDVLFEANGRKSSSDRSTLGSGGVDLLCGSPVSFDDVFGGPPKFAPPSYSSQLASSQSLYDIFSIRVKTSNKGSSFPVFDAPLHDDDTFGGVQGIRSAAGAHGVFSGSSTAGPSLADLEDLLSGFIIADTTERSTNQRPSSDSETPSTTGAFAFDELLPGIFGTERTKPRSAGDGNPAQQKSSGLVDGFPAAAVRISALAPPSVPDLDPLINLASPSGGRCRNGSCNGVAEGSVAFQNSSPPSPAASNAPKKAVNTVMAIPTPIPRRMSAIKESGNGDSLSRSNSNNNHVEDLSETSSNSPKLQPDVYVGNTESASTDSPSRRNRRVPSEAAVFPQNHQAEDPIQMQKTPNCGHVDEIWISIKDVKLVTRPTVVPPPSRPPPKPRSKQGYASRKPSYSKTEGNSDLVTDSNGFAVARETVKTSGPSPRSKARPNKFTSAVDEPKEKLKEGSSSVRAPAVALKGARAGAKLRLSEEVQEKEREEKDREAGAARVREEQVEAREVRERGDKMAREKEKKEKARQREEKERESRAIRRREEQERELRHRKEMDKAAAEAQEKAKKAAAEKAATAREQQDASLDERHVSSTDGQPRSSGVSSATGGQLAPSDFPEVEGESAERRRSRLERHLRILERSATALHEKNQRDLQSQKDQAERHRAAGTLDIKIKRWAAGKEGNLRALLSTLQYVLWPESGWQAVSLRDLITAAAVKQVYRKATVCVHPDKLQQRGATILQKYTAEKVFHLLNEAWNKFKSGELFERVN